MGLTNRTRNGPPLAGRGSYPRRRMTDLLAAAAELLNAPSDLVQRSAAARAKAHGSSVDDVLSAWTGGAPVAAAAPASPPPASVPQAPVVPASAVEPQPAPAAVAVADPVEVPPVETRAEPEIEYEPVPLRERIKVGSKAGALMGAVMALFTIVFSIQWLLPHASVVGETGAFSAAVEVVPGWLALAAALLGAASGVLVAGMSRMITGWRGPGWRLSGSGRGALVGGGVLGALFGLLLAALLAGISEPVGESLGSIHLAPALAWTIAIWSAAGWGVGLLVQALGTPYAITSEEAHAAHEVRSRLGSAYGIPVTAILAIALLAGPAAYVFLSFPSWAPVMGMFIAASILGFAGLAASRPGMKISAGEFLIASAGIAVIVVIVAAILTAQGRGHSEEPSQTETRAAVVALV